MKPEPKRILQITAPPQPVWAVYFLNDKDDPEPKVEVEWVALWALVELEDETTNVYGMDCQFGFEFCDTSPYFIGYAQANSKEEAPERFSTQIEHRRSEWEKQRAQPTST